LKIKHNNRLVWLAKGLSMQMKSISGWTKGWPNCARFTELCVAVAREFNHDTCPWYLIFVFTNCHASYILSAIHFPYITLLSLIRCALYFRFVTFISFFCITFSLDHYPAPLARNYILRTRTKFNVVKSVSSLSRTVVFPTYVGFERISYLRYLFLS